MAGCTKLRPLHVNEWELHQTKKLVNCTSNIFCQRFFVWFLSLWCMLMFYYVIISNSNITIIKIKTYKYYVWIDSHFVLTTALTTSYMSAPISCTFWLLLLQWKSNVSMSPHLFDGLWSHRVAPCVDHSPTCLFTCLPSFCFTHLTFFQAVK